MWLVPFYTVTSVRPISLANSRHYLIANVENRKIGRGVWDKRANNKLTKDKRMIKNNKPAKSIPYAALLQMEMAH
jgi:hypothetical protein